MHLREVDAGTATVVERSEVVEAGRGWYAVNGAVLPHGCPGSAPLWSWLLGDHEALPRWSAFISALSAKSLDSISDATNAEHGTTPTLMRCLSGADCGQTRHILRDVTGHYACTCRQAGLSEGGSVIASTCTRPSSSPVVVIALAGGSSPSEMTVCWPLFLFS